MRKKLSAIFVITRLENGDLIGQAIRHTNKRFGLSLIPPYAGGSLSIYSIAGGKGDVSLGEGRIEYDGDEAHLPAIVQNIEERFKLWNVPYRIVVMPGSEF